MTYDERRLIQAALKGRVASKSLARAQAASYEHYRSSTAGHGRIIRQDHAAVIILQNETQWIVPLENAARERTKEIAALHERIDVLIQHREHPTWSRVSEFING